VHRDPSSWEQPRGRGRPRGAARGAARCVARGAAIADSDNADGGSADGDGADGDGSGARMTTRRRGRTGVGMNRDADFVYY
jgi:hypothetical protein